MVQVTNGYVSDNTIKQAISDMTPNVNTAPVADAGQDQTLGENVPVSLDGTGSKDNDAGDSIASYLWRQSSGTSVQLNGSLTATPDFTTPKTINSTESLQFELTVTDTHGKTGTDTCIVTVQNTMNPPVANAGSDKNVDENVSVTLDGSGSTDNDPGDSIASYSWSQTSGTVVTLSNTTSAKPQFTSPATSGNGASLKFEVQVTDTTGLTDTDECIVNVLAKNPIADAGSDQTVEEGDLVTLNGSQSECGDPNDPISSYSWKQKSGSVSVTLSNANAESPTFSAPTVNQGSITLEFDLTITCNGIQASDSCRVQVTNGANTAPVARATYSPNNNVKEGTIVTLSGELSSDPDGNDDIVSYSWEQIDTGGSNVSLSYPDADRKKAVFTTPATASDTEEFSFRLTVEDKAGATSEAICTVTVTKVNSPPVANAGFIWKNFVDPVKTVVVEPGTTQTMSGQASTDPDGAADIDTYTWVQIAGKNVELSCIECLDSSFVVPEQDGDDNETYRFKLTVKDKEGLEAEAECTAQVIGTPEEWGCFINSFIHED